MLILPLIVATSIGYLFISLLFKNIRPFSSTLQVSLSIGLGLGLVSLLTFLSFLLIGQYNRLFICVVTILILIILLTLNVIFSKNTPYAQKSVLKHFSLISILSVFPWIIFFLTCTLSANLHPYGEWDAWALYNMKTKFLLFGGTSWKAIFNELHWSTQPDYPLLLPLFNTWSFALLGQNLLKIPYLTSIVATFSCGFLLQTGLKKYTSPLVGFLALVFLLANPFYVYLGTSQYADVLLGYYLLAGFVAITLLFREQDARYAVILAIILGLMTFTKNEGIAIASILSLLVVTYLWIEKSFDQKFKKTATKSFLIALILAISLTLYFKLALAPRNRDIFIDPAKASLPYLNWDGLVLILGQMKAEALNRRWAFVWIFSTVLILLGWTKVFYKECKIFSLFFIFYFMVLILIYMTTVHFELSWRLKYTLHRIYGYFLPSVLYFVFYINWRKKELT
jgi:hypothetical protein